MANTGLNFYLTILLEMGGVSGEPLVNNFKIPSWAAKPPAGVHLDVMKDGKLIQKLMMDDKSCYFFGRNRQLCDFAIDHQSCSRIHAALVWHKNLNRAFLIDLGSVHGTFIGRIKLEPERPQQVPVDSEIHFGASTRVYIIRERPNPIINSSTAEADRLIKEAADATGNANKLPQSEVELDNLTQFNTAHNRRIAVSDMQPPTVSAVQRGRRNSLNQRHSVHFSDIEEVINPEDVDPSIGRFRNLVQETFIPNKARLGADKHEGADIGIAAPKPSLTPPTSSNTETATNQSTRSAAAVSNPSFTLAAKLGLPMPNLAPEIDSVEPQTASLLHRLPTMAATRLSAEDILGGPLPGPKEEGTTGAKRSATASSMGEEAESSAPKKKKYAKEAWPGKRPGFLVGPSVA
ncbi:Nuclear inhibitor of protein phosphatase 1 [Echinococcus granulosus]|uniref:Nuclear inhibitor of protein phosphatase 1 n=1 Tax=Echinococcus granulosus TaxID=6210 RepID=A0A068WS37_ECHGR|nr:Nuclear inhibitor of protein phosphatase 1 [Echinococcus granulosus]CDS22950.1 Nuclear inhibitor of protein phosphatase 1 [Echinococcus granulosus]